MSSPDHPPVAELLLEDHEGDEPGTINRTISLVLRSPPHDMSAEDAAEDNDDNDDGSDPPLQVDEEQTVTTDCAPSTSGTQTLSRQTQQMHGQQSSSEEEETASADAGQDSGSGMMKIMEIMDTDLVLDSDTENDDDPSLMIEGRHFDVVSEADLPQPAPGTRKRTRQTATGSNGLEYELKQKGPVIKRREDGRLMRTIRYYTSAVPLEDMDEDDDDQDLFALEPDEKVKDETKANAVSGRVLSIISIIS